MYKNILILFILLYSSLAFSDCNLKNKIIDNCNFSNKNFERYNFSNKYLSNINFKNSNLFGAILNKTSLKNVDFSDANLFGAFFVESSLENVVFNRSDISSADFTGTTVIGTSFLKATKEDTIFGKMKIEKPEVVKAQNCKLVVSKEYKFDWAIFILGLSLKGTAESDKFVVNSLCNWHPKSTFLLRGISSSKGKEKLSINYNYCTFPVSIWTDEDNKKTYIESSYRSICLKESNFSSNTSHAKVKWVGIDVKWTCGFGKYCFTDKNLRVNGPGYVPDNGNQERQTISRMNNALEGNYTFSVSANKGRINCSGSFSLSGTKQHYFIRLYDNCDDAGSGEY